MTDSRRSTEKGSLLNLYNIINTLIYHRLIWPEVLGREQASTGFIELWVTADGAGTARK